MARLFIRHEPVDCHVQPGLRAPHVFVVRRLSLTNNGISLDSYLNDCVYVCIVHEGVVWAARSLHSHEDTSLVRILCSKLEDQPCVQQMLLADMLLN
jgi:hypothetical protein